MQFMMGAIIIRLQQRIYLQVKQLKMVLSIHTALTILQPTVASQMTIEYDQGVTYTCQVFGGTPPYNTTWMHTNSGGTTAVARGIIEVEVISIIFFYNLLFNATQEDEGSYYCMVIDSSPTSRTSPSISLVIGKYYIIIYNNQLLSLL